ncbi:RlpA-like double-psi beta-barrel domain-containing protein [Deinococcus phoenicis]|uniref:hypothetical protein n=1 Tax=Deinococcus phoenicis TaxID=1476583 RepID=UPI0004BAE78B|nr:hypothetical protein [Deinococcus phoenicis]
MSHTLYRWMGVILLTAVGAASATPLLPTPSVAAQAVRDALAPEAPVLPQPSVSVQPAAPTAAVQPSGAVQAAQTRALGVQLAETELARGTSRTGRSAVVRATAYNSTPGQTDSTPFITATGTRVRSGVVALSRDLLRSFPYGSKIMIEDLSGRYNNLFRGRVFTVEDTMAARKTGSLDIWMSTRSQAIQFGARQVRITAVR